MILGENKYIYIYGYREKERDLCKMEMRSFFNVDTDFNYLMSHIAIEPSRSPFIQNRLEILYEGTNLDTIKQFAKGIALDPNQTYKVVSLNTLDFNTTKKIPHLKRREVERDIALIIDGEPDLKNPHIEFGVVLIEETWYFGIIKKGEAVWLKHQTKPNNYSTALSTKMARAIVNIAIPFPHSIRAIDPCCGIGTVVIEALSMGIQMEGRDINHFVCKGSRENIAYFGLEGKITLGPIRDITEHYDVAIIDLPYNLFTHASERDQFDILQCARSIADTVLVVTVETIDHLIKEAGFKIIDRCVAPKQNFSRQVLLCH